MNELNKFIGIPFKINGWDLTGCNCAALCWLYFKIIYKKDFPHYDGKRLLFRNPHNDFKRILSVLTTWASPISYEELRKNDIVILKADPKKKICALGVLIDNFQVLCMREKRIGSCLIKKKYLKDLFVKGYRPNEAFI